MFDLNSSASFDPDDLDTPGDHGPPARYATLEGLNVMASAIMEHVIEHDRRQEARIDDLEATVVTLRKRVQQLASAQNGKPLRSAGAPDPTGPGRPVFVGL